MDTTHPPRTHAWEHHHLAAQILRAWIRETYGNLPAWTPPDVANAYVGLLSAVQHLVQATSQAEKEERPGA